MARPTLKAFNWAALAERIHEADKPIFTTFKAKSDQFLRQVQELPESMPKIDWSYYKNQISVPGMVDSFQKQLESVSIPYPKDTYTAQLDAEKQTHAEEMKQFIQESNGRINEYEQEINKVKNLLPFDQMTMEDFRDAYPDQALDPINRPTVWPHRAEDQIEKEPEPH